MLVLNRREVSDVLRERPPVPGVILDRILSFAERHVRRRLNNPGTTSLRMLEVLVNIRTLMWT